MPTPHYAPPAMSAARRGGCAKGRERREAILHAANEVFAAQGFHGAALSTIATRVGLSEPGLLHHFPSKEHLLLELLAMRHEHDADRVARALEHHESFLDALLGLCRENQGTPGLVRLFAILAAESVDDDHPAHDWMLERYRTLRERFVPRIEAEQRAGRIDATLDPQRLAPRSSSRCSTVSRSSGCWTRTPSTWPRCSRTSSTGCAPSGSSRGYVRRQVVAGDQRPHDGVCTCVRDH
jgi:AcrR family transcriptional regulator